MNTRRSFFANLSFAAGALIIVVLTGMLLAADPTVAGVADHLVINELSSASAVSSYDDWVELYNPTDSDIDLSGWSLQKTTSGGTITRTDLRKTIPAHGYFLVARNHTSTDQNLKNMADLSASNFGLADNNGLYLVHSNTSIDPDDPLAEYVDLVGWGGIKYGETASYPANITAGKSLVRTSDGEDTDDNSVDFVLLDTPTPQNSGLNDSGEDLTGTVWLTITPADEPVQSITPVSASIVFRVNADSNATVEYGPDDTYGSETARQQ